MGMRVRLKASFDISSFSATNQSILKALKQYGRIMADNGSSMDLSGAPDDPWDNNDLHKLSTLTASDFEVLTLGSVCTSANVPQGCAPIISSFAASATNPVSRGTTVTLSWNATSASYSSSRRRSARSAAPPPSSLPQKPRPTRSTRPTSSAAAPQPS
jgi:hypothetical protein